MAIPLKQLIAQLTAGNGKWTPYDPALNSLVGSAQARLGQLHSSYGKNVNRTKIDYGRQERDLTQDQARAMDANRSDWVGRGLGRSGIFAHSQGEVSQEYQKRLRDLVSERTRTLEGYSQAKASGETDLRESLMQGQADAANRYTAKKQADAQSAAEAKHNQAMLELQRQQTAAQLEAARAQANAFRGGMGLGGQTFPGGQQPGPAQLWADLAAMPKEQRDHWMLWNVYLPKLQQQQQDIANRRPQGRPGHYNLR